MFQNRLCNVKVRIKCLFVCLFYAIIFSTIEDLFIYSFIISSMFIEGKHKRKHLFGLQELAKEAVFLTGQK